jgi:uncharacterized protein (DUF924 family)
MPAESDHQEIDPGQVIEAWFGDACTNPDALGPRSAFWFGPDKDRDRELKEVFGNCCQAALDGELNHWQSEPQSRLALILLLDQFPRNLFRGTPRAFAGDDRAAMLCLAGVAAAMDAKLDPVERVFFYMPLQHAEDVVAQKVSLELFFRLAEEQSERPEFMGFAQFAKQHLDLIEQFGRFPHRNEVLGRPSTPEEKAYLDSGGERFGQ